MNNYENLAEVYRTLSELTKEAESKELSAILKKVKSAAANGEFTLKVNIDEDIYQWLRDFIFNKRDDLKPDILSELDRYGFTYGSPNISIKWFSTKYTMIISWKGMED